MLGRKILAFVWKDIRLFAADRQAVVMSFIVPVLIASILGWLDSSASSDTDPKAIPLMVVDQDRSGLSKEIVAFPGVQRVEQRRSTISLELEDLTRDLPAVLAEIERRGGKIESVRSDQASLEQVFLHLTGRVLRD